MRVIFSVFVLLFSSLLFADMKSEIATLLEEQDQAWNRGDLDGFVKPYDDTGRLVFIGSSGVIRDPRALKEKYEKKYKVAGADFGKLTFSDLQVEELSKDLALAWGRWEVEAKGTKSSGWFSLILQKSAGKWRILHDHSS